MSFPLVQLAPFLAAPYSELQWPFLTGLFFFPCGFVHTSRCHRPMTQPLLPSVAIFSHAPVCLNCNVFGPLLLSVQDCSVTRSQRHIVFSPFTHGPMPCETPPSRCLLHQCPGLLPFKNHVRRITTMFLERFFRSLCILEHALQFCLPVPLLFLSFARPPPPSTVQHSLQANWESLTL